MRFYFAGKISRRGWRNTIIQESLEQVNPYTDNTILRESVIFGVHDYTGPYFVKEAGHGFEQYEGNMHGRIDPGDQDIIGHGFDRANVLESCFEGIRACDVVFAWIDCFDAYGTLVELGFAYATRKQIWIASPRPLQDMWFAYELADKTCYNEKSASAALLKLLPPVVKPARVSIAAGLRFEILRRDDYRCQLCGARATDGEQLHIDHRTPVVAGGTNDPSNLWTLCKTCNLGKGARFLEDPDREFATRPRIKIGASLFPDDNET